MSLLDAELFDGCNHQTSKKIAQLEKSPKCFKKGETIYSHEHFSKSFGFVVSGRLSFHSHNGKGGVILRHIGEGGCFGAAALFCENKSYVSDIVAQTDAEIVFIGEDDFRGILANDSQVAFNYIRFLSGRINFLNTLIAGYSASNAEKKIAHFLLKYYGDDNNEKPIGMSELTKIIGIGRASLYRILGDFEQQGLIVKKGKDLTISDRERLADLIK